MITLATKITLIRLCLIPVFILTAFINFPYHVLIAGIIYAVTAITDILDGAIARKTNTVSKLGKILDPIADKALQVCGLLYVVIYQMYFFPITAIVMASIILLREIVISVMRALALKQGLTLTPDIFGKLKTIFLNISIPVVMLAVSLLTEFGYNDLRYDFFKGLATAVYYVAFILTVISAVRYFYTNRTVIKTVFDSMHAKKKRKGSDETV